jgi:hypothetical protein
MALYLSSEFKAAVRAAAKARGVAVYRLAEEAGFRHQSHVAHYFTEKRAGARRPTARYARNRTGRSGGDWSAKGPKPISERSWSPVQDKFRRLAERIGFDGKIFVRR